MNETVALELPRELVQKARAAAARKNRPFESVVADWIERGLVDEDVDQCPDEHILELARTRLEDSDQQDLSELLAANAEGELDAPGQRRLDELMARYRTGLVIKARAMREAVKRGLMARLDDHAA